MSLSYTHIPSQAKHVLGTEEVLHIFPTSVRKKCDSWFQKCKQCLVKVTGTRGNTIIMKVIHCLWGTDDSDLTIEEKVHIQSIVDNA